jgi:hypothetical protein
MHTYIVSVTQSLIHTTTSSWCFPARSTSSWLMAYSKRGEVHPKLPTSLKSTLRPFTKSHTSGAPFLSKKPRTAHQSCAMTIRGPGSFGWRWCMDVSMDRATLPRSRLSGTSSASQTNTLSTRPVPMPANGSMRGFSHKVQKASSRRTTMSAKSSYHAMLLTMHLVSPQAQRGWPTTALVISRKSARKSSNTTRALGWNTASSVCILKRNIFESAGR